MKCYPLLLFQNADRLGKRFLVKYFARLLVPVLPGQYMIKRSLYRGTHKCFQDSPCSGCVKKFYPIPNQLNIELLTFFQNCFCHLKYRVSHKNISTVKRPYREIYTNDL